MYYPKIQGLLKNYIGFYFGCILWAVYIKQFDNADILNNLCYGGEYNEEETLGEIDFIKNYIDQLKKDAKYYIGQDFSIDETSLKIIDAYREFLKSCDENKLKTFLEQDPLYFDKIIPYAIVFGIETELTEKVSHIMDEL
jgi:hypothetical protein